MQPTAHPMSTPTPMVTSMAGKKSLNCDKWFSKSCIFRNHITSPFYETASFPRGFYLPPSSHWVLTIWKQILLKFSDQYLIGTHKGHMIRILRCKFSSIRINLAWRIKYEDNAMSPFSKSDEGPQPRVRWLFLDLNSYFASVEQELRPELRDRPVVVVPVMADTTCCIAASYEAKKFGIFTGTQVGDAKRLCPDIELVDARHELYVDYHKKIVAAVETCVPVSTVMSIDEMACSLMGREQSLVVALNLARQVKETIKREVGSQLRCSIGLASNRYLAKIASDMEKPDGLVALTSDILKPALQKLELRALPGVGARMEKHLNTHGIKTMAQLLELDREALNEAWGGVGGDKLYYWLRGEDFNDPKLEHQKSVSQSHMLPPEFRTRDGAYAIAHKLLHKAAMRLRAANLWVRNVSLAVKFAVPKEVAKKLHHSGIPQRGWSRGMTVVECQDNQTLVDALCKLWADLPKGEQYQQPFFVGVWLGNLVPDHLHTLSLFSGLEAESRRTRLSSTMDALNHKYGLDTLFPASMLPAKAAAPTRIAFTSIPDLFE
jgi:DNA polymerase-4